MKYFIDKPCLPRNLHNSDAWLLRSRQGLSIKYFLDFEPYSSVMMSRSLGLSIGFDAACYISVWILIPPRPLPSCSPLLSLGVCLSNLLVFYRFLPKAMQMMDQAQVGAFAGLAALTCLLATGYWLLATGPVRNPWLKLCRLVFVSMWIASIRHLIRPPVFRTGFYRL